MTYDTAMLLIHAVTLIAIVALLFVVIITKDD